MTLSRIAVIFDNQARPETTGGYCLRALQQLATVAHCLPGHLDRLPRTGIDVYLDMDDGLHYHVPCDLQPCPFWAIGTIAGDPNGNNGNFARGSIVCETSIATSKWL